MNTRAPQVLIEKPAPIAPFRGVRSGSEIDMSRIVRHSWRFQARDCGAPASPSDYTAGLPPQSKAVELGKRYTNKYLKRSG